MQSCSAPGQSGCHGRRRYGKQMANPTVPRARSPPARPPTRPSGGGHQPMMATTSRSTQWSRGGSTCCSSSVARGAKSADVKSLALPPHYVPTSSSSLASWRRARGQRPPPPRFDVDGSRGGDLSPQSSILTFGRLILGAVSCPSRRCVARSSALDGRWLAAARVAAAQVPRRGEAAGVELGGGGGDGNRRRARSPVESAMLPDADGGEGGAALGGASAAAPRGRRRPRPRRAQRAAGRPLHQSCRRHAPSERACSRFIPDEVPPYYTASSTASRAPSGGRSREGTLANLLWLHRRRRRLDPAAVEAFCARRRPRRR